MFLSIGMLKQKYFLADIFILSAEKQPIKLSWQKIECLPNSAKNIIIFYNYCLWLLLYSEKEWSETLLLLMDERF